MNKPLSSLLNKQDLKNEPKELQIITHELFSRGKGLRSRLVSCLSSHLSLKKEDLKFLCRIVEGIHNSSLLHDDFIDGSFRRRGELAAWHKFSPTQAVLAGDFILARINLFLCEYLSQGGELRLLHKTSLAICDLARGEFLQRQLIPFKSLDLKKLDQVSELKTGSLFKWCLEAPFLSKKRSDPKLLKVLDRLGFYMGVLFQRSDDLLDFGFIKSNKKVLQDIKQKHFNSFACFLLQKKPSKKSKLKRVKSLKELSILFPDLKDIKEEFDDLNKGIIKKAKKEAANLKPFLSEKEQLIILEIQAWMELLYFREIKSG